MKFSKDTFAILKNFAEINTGLHFKQGTVLKTISPKSSIVAEAVIKEEIPRDFTIYDLNKFLAIESLFNDPDFEIKDDHLLVKAGNKSIRYGFADPSTVKGLSKNIEVPEAQIKFTLKKEELSILQKAALILKAPHLVVESSGDSIRVNVQDINNSATDAFKVDVSVNPNKNFRLVIKVENLKIVDGDYEVAFSKAEGKSGVIVGNFKNLSCPIQYWVALEKESQFS
jgi:hypothetical protein